MKRVGEDYVLVRLGACVRGCGGLFGVLSFFFSSLWSDRMDGWIRVTGGASQPDDGYVQFIFNCFSFRPTYTSTMADFWLCM